MDGASKTGSSKGDQNQNRPPGRAVKKKTPVRSGKAIFKATNLSRSPPLVTSIRRISSIAIKGKVLKHPHSRPLPGEKFAPKAEAG